MLDDNQTVPDIEAGNSDAQAQLLGKSQHPAHPPGHLDKPEGMAGCQESCPPADHAEDDQNTPNVQGEKSCCQSCRQLLKKNWKIVFTVFCLVPALAAVLGWCILRGQWLQTRHGRWFLSSVGLAVVVCMALIPYLTFTIFLEQVAQKIHHEEEMFQACAKTMQDEDICRLTNLTHFDRWRKFHVIRIFCRALLNVFMVVYNLFYLPPRDPHRALNQTKHLLAWLELGGVALMLVLVWVPKDTVQNLTGCLKLPGHSLYTARVVRNLADFSALSLLRLANPQEFLTRVRQSFSTGFEHTSAAQKWAVIGVEVASFLLGACVGIAALVVKISATSFVSAADFGRYDPLELITIAGFLNNIIGLMRIDDLRIEAVARMYFETHPNLIKYRSQLQNGQRIRRVFQQALYEALRHDHGFWDGSGLWLSITVEDVLKLISGMIGKETKDGKDDEETKGGKDDEVTKGGKYMTRCTRCGGKNTQLTE